MADMYRVCTICKKGFHTGVSTRKTCDRIVCQDWYKKKHPRKPHEGRTLGVFKNRIEAEENIVRSVTEARKRGMSYGVYTAFKERNWVK